MAKMMRVLVEVTDDDVVTFHSTGGNLSLAADNDGPTWKAVGEDLVRYTKAFGKEVI